MFYLACWPLLALVIGGMCLVGTATIVNAAIRRKPSVPAWTLMPCVSLLLLCMGVRERSEALMNLMDASMTVMMLLALFPLGGTADREQ